MKKALREYQYDWSLRSVFRFAARSRLGTRAEYELLLGNMPAFQGALGTILGAGKPGDRLLAIVYDFLDDIVSAEKKGKKVAVTTFCFPPIILDAFDVVNLSAEPLSVLGTVVYRRGAADFADFCVEAGYSETACAAQRGALGAIVAELTSRPDFVICNTPGVCDTNAHAYAFIASYMDLPFFQLNYPPELTSKEAREYHRRDFRALIRFLEEQTGQKLSENRLRESLMELEKQDELVNEIMELQRIIPCPVPPISGFFIYAGRFLAGGRKSCTRLLEDILEVSIDNYKKGVAGTPSGNESARLMFMYLDHYNPGLAYWQWMNEKDISCLGNVLDVFWNRNAPYSEGREEQTYGIDRSSFDAIIDGIADQTSRMPMIKQVRGPYDAPHMWLEDLTALATTFKPDCLVYAGSAGCRNTWGMVKLAARDLEEMGYPTLLLNSDGFEPRVQSWELTATRLEEFLRVRRIWRETSN